MKIALKSFILFWCVTVCFGNEVVELRLACHPKLDSNIAEIASEATKNVFVDGKLVARWSILKAEASKDDVVIRSVDGKREILALFIRPAFLQISHSFIKHNLSFFMAHVGIVLGPDGLLVDFLINL